MGAVLAFDIGGTKLAAGVVDSEGRVRGFVVEPTRRDEGPEQIVPRLFALGRRSIAASGDSAPVAIGISCGGPLDAEAGVLVDPFHLPGWAGLPIVSLTEEEFGLPAVLENDASAAALAEYLYGAARGANTMIYLTISTGVGGGAVIGGVLHRGAAGNGGEFGHITVVRGGRRCGCGRRGCLEAYASGSSIARRAAERLEAGEPSALGLPVTAERVAAMALSGDVLALSVWDETCELLGQAISDMVNLLEPDVVVLGGGVTRAGVQLLDPVARIVANTAMPPAARAARVALAGLGDAVCIVGAGAVAFERLLS